VDDDLKWYYLQNGRSLGPFSKDQLIHLAFSGAIPTETLVWTSSQDQEWKSLSEAFNLNDELPPPLPNKQIHSTLGSTITTSQSNLDSNAPHPWRRYFARQLDNIANGTVMWMAIGMTLASVAPTEANRFFSFISDPKNKFVDIFLTCLIVPFANAAFIGFTGGSVGKWFFGIKVVDQAERQIGYSLALKREFLVWMYGLGFGIPLVSFFTALHQKSQLEKNRISSWDKDLNLRVVYRENGALQHLLSIVGVVLIITIHAVLTTL